MLITKSIKQENLFSSSQEFGCRPNHAKLKVDKTLLRPEFEPDFVDLFILCQRQEKPFSVLPTYGFIMIFVKQFHCLLIYVLRVNRLPLSRLHSPQTNLSDTQPLQ